MPLKANEIYDLINSLKAAETWDNSSLENKIKSYFDSAFNVPVRPVHRSHLLLSYHLDLKKELDPDYRECLIFLVRIPGDFKPDSLTPIIESMRYYSLREGLAGQPHLIFLFGGYNNIKKHFEDELWGNIISDETEFIEWLKKTLPRKDILYKLKMGSLDMIKCPFQYLGPCSTDMFVGREKLIKEILLESQLGYVIAGGRRIGKTSLLFKLQSEMKESKKISQPVSYHPLYIDCSNFSGFQYLIEEICRKLFPKYYLDHTSTCYKFNFNQILRRVKGLWNETLFLLLDEMDPLVEKAKEKNEDTNLFFNALRAEANTRTLRLVITGFREVSELIQNTDNPFYNICEKKYLGVLNYDEVKELISRPFSRMGIRLEPQEKIIANIYDYTAGYPSMVQFIARQLFKSRKGFTITMEDLNQVISSEQSIDFILDTFIMNSSKLERLICLLVIQKEKKEFNHGEILDIIDKEGIKLSDSSVEVYKALRNLTFNNILMNVNAQYRFLYPLMKHIIKENYLSTNVVLTLKREVNG